VHLESHSDPHDRAVQVEILLDAIDDYADGLPVIIGGDFNTKSAGRDEAKDPAIMDRLMRADPQRLIHPVPHEPLFERVVKRGYDWRSCNTGDATQRSRPDGTPAPPFGRLDWFFTRGLQARQARTVAAVDDAGTAISDHELLMVTIG
jgi:endonuclease/exonuclease/phosphatase family metal-dependent hydrolase